jgi:BlaI family penicillinase repressor
MANHGISETQWRVMEIVWQRGSVTAADVIDVLLPETGWSHQTVRTLLARLVQKGVLHAEPVRNYYVYTPLVSREESIHEEGESFVNRVFGGRADELLVHFVREGKINSETLQKLQNLIKREQRTRKEASDD